MAGRVPDGRRHLVAAVLVREERVLLCRRSSARAWFPGVWDLPGGHLESGESAAHALVREIREELGIEIGALTISPARRVVTEAFELGIWRLDRWSGLVRNAAPAEHDAIGWFSRAELGGLPFADERLRSMVGGLLATPIVPAVRPCGDTVTC